MRNKLEGNIECNHWYCSYRECEVITYKIECGYDLNAEEEKTYNKRKSDRESSLR